MTVDFDQLVEEARADIDHVPEGWVQTDNLEVIPDVGTALIVKFDDVRNKLTSAGYPRIQIRCFEPESGLSFFENLNWSHSKESNRITMATLAQLGVPASIVDQGLDAIIETISGSWNYAVIKGHNARDTRTFCKILWNTPPEDEASAIARSLASAEALYEDGEILPEPEEVDSDSDW